MDLKEWWRKFWRVHGLLRRSRSVQIGWHLSIKLVERWNSFINQHLLNELKENIDLYRDDGLSILRNMSGLEIEKRKEELVRVSKNNGVSVTA